MGTSVPFSFTFKFTIMDIGIFIMSAIVSYILIWIGNKIYEETVMKNNEEDE